MKRKLDLEEILSSYSDDDLRNLVRLIIAYEENRKLEAVEVESQEKLEMDEILSAFEPYIKGHYYFDIVYSAKFGFLYLDMDKNVEQCKTADDLMRFIINELFGDIKEAELGAAETEAAMNPAEEAQLRSRAVPFIEKLSDSEHYLNILDAYISESKAEAFLKKEALITAMEQNAIQPAHE